MNALEQLSNFFWQGPLLIILIGVGVYQTYTLKGLQFRYLGHALKLVFWPFEKKKKSKKGDITSFQSLMTALAGAIGTGNITGIAAAVVIGGLGALFWMWVIALFGMAIAYSEVLLAVKFRDVNEEGAMSGGPMYTILHGLKAKKTAWCFALFGAIAAFGIGALVQSNSVADAMELIIPGSRLTTGIVLAIAVGLVVLGGIQSIGRVAGVVVPVMAILYIAAGGIVLALHWDRILDAFYLIVTSAFTGQAAAGGFAGASMLAAIRMGASNGLFANEAGLGSLAIAGASAQVAYPARQGMYAIAGVFISTMLICTITGLVLAVTQVVGTSINGQVVSGSPLAMIAFSTVFPQFQYVVLIGLIFFAFTTILAWAYYGEKCFEYLLGVKFAHLYRWVYTGVVVVGALLELNLVWTLAHFANAFMALPNLYSIVRLSKTVKEETMRYIKEA